MSRDYGTQTVSDRWEAAHNTAYNALQTLREFMEARRAKLRAMFPTPSPGEVRRYIVPAEMTLGDLTVRTHTSVIARAPDVAPNYRPDIIKTEYITGKILCVNTKEVETSSGPDREKSILDTIIHIRDDPNTDVDMRNLLSSLNIEPVDFAHLEHTQQRMEFDDLQGFVYWVHGMLEILNEDHLGSTGEEGERSGTKDLSRRTGYRRICFG